MLPASNVALQEERDASGADTTGSNVVVFNPNATRSISQQRVMLPIYQNKHAIMYLLENYPTVVIVGSTGCGKTTQIPQYLDEYGWTAGGRIVACTQPRRIAAASVAARVAVEKECELGQEVGYSIRFDDRTTPDKTRIKFMTDGMLIREMMTDPLLSRYSVVMLDEAHERSLYTDILVGLLKKVQKKRKDLRLIISSATVDALEFKEFFNTKNWINEKLADSVGILSVPGRQYPVEIFYTSQPVANYIHSAVECIFAIHKTEPRGDILVFMTGQEEIEELLRLVRERMGTLRPQDMKMLPLPMYSGLPSDQQMLIFRPTSPNVRKVIVATNVAETSITIDGIVFVIDSGFVKIRAYNPLTTTESLVVVPVSQSSANQRAGRAGRLAEGKCYRLFTEESFHQLPVKATPEMLRTNLAMVVLQLKAMGIDNVVHFDFMSPPPSAAMIRALEHLYSLGALDDNARLTQGVGLKMAEFPIDPPLAKMLLASAEYSCTEEILTIAAMLQVQNVFQYPKGAQAKVDKIKRMFAVFEGDHFTLLNVYNSFLRNKQDTKWCQSRHINARAVKRAIEIRKQLQKYAHKFGVGTSSTTDVTAIQKCLISGYFANAARLQPDGMYKTIRSNHILQIHPNSVLFKYPPNWVIYHEIVQTAKGDYMRDVVAIEAQWLADIAPHFYEFKGMGGPGGSNKPPPRADNVTHSYFSEPMNIL